MKAKLLKIPDPVEWDFRGVQPEALADAALYEYARASDKIREVVCRASDTKCNGQTLRKRMIALLKKGDKSAIHQAEIMAAGGFAEAGLPITLWHHFNSRPDFPEPWLARPLEFRRNPRYSLIRIARRSNAPGPANGWPPPSIGFAEYPGAGSWMPFAFDIEWPGATIEKIATDFKRWLAKEAKRHPEMKQRGQAGQLQLAPLKDLAALRLHNAGLSFMQVQAMLDCYLKPRDTTARNMALDAGIDLESIPRQSASRNVFNAEEMLPLYQNPPAFSAALKRAKARLKALV